MNGARNTMATAAAAVGFVTGTALLAVSMRMAETAGPGAAGHFAVFWVAMAAALVPLAAVAVGPGTRDRWRWVAVVAAAVFTTLPKLLRTWSGPLYSDEFGHLYQTRRVLDGGLSAMGDENPLLRVAPDFPLLHWLTAGLHSVGVDLWVAAMSVASVAHVVTLVAVALLVRTVAGSTRLGAVGAFVYLLQPGWLFFSAQFAYETLGLPLLVVTLWAALEARRRDDGRARTALLAGTVAGAAATVLAHHFAGFVLAVLLVAVAVAGEWRDETRFRLRRADRATAAVATALIAGWLVSRAPHLWPYYEPTVSSGFDRVRDPFSEPGTRSVFSGSPAPVFERWAGVALPFVLAPLATVAVVHGRAAVWGRHVTAVFTVLAGSFFASLPLLLTVSGSEPAHRWWAYAYLGFAVMFAAAAPGVAAHLRGSTPRRGVLACVAGSVAVAVAAVGGVAAGTTVGYRFPGPPEVGNDARSVSSEARAVAEWLYDESGPGVESGVRVLADRYTAQQLVGWGEQITSRPSTGYPAWDLLFSTDPATLEAVARDLQRDRVRFVVVDERMTTDRPVLGYWFNRTEPGAFGDELVPVAALAKFACADWAEDVHREGFLTVYRVDPVLLEQDAGRGQVCP